MHVDSDNTRKKTKFVKKSRTGEVQRKINCVGLEKCCKMSFTCKHRFRYSQERAFQRLGNQPCPNFGRPVLGCIEAELDQSTSNTLENEYWPSICLRQTASASIQPGTRPPKFVKRALDLTKNMPGFNTYSRARGFGAALRLHQGRQEFH